MCERFLKNHFAIFFVNLFIKRSRRRIYSLFLCGVTEHTPAGKRKRKSLIEKNINQMRLFVSKSSRSTVLEIIAL